MDSNVLLSTSNKQNERNLEVKSIKQIILSLFRLWFPTLISQLAYNISYFLSSSIISSKLDQKYYDAVALGGSFFNMIGVIPFYILSSTVQTLVSQAFGRKDFQECIRVLFISIIILSIYTFCLSLIIIFGRPLLNLFVINSEIQKYVYEYLIFSIPLLITTNGYYLMSIYFTSVLVAFPPMIISIIGCILSPIFCYLLVEYSKIGYLGIIFATLFTEIIQLIALILVILLSKKFKEIIVKFNLFFCASWRKFLKLGIPTMLFGSLEYWSYSILLLSIGRLDDHYIASNFMLNNIYNILSVVSLSIGGSIASFVGNSLGKNQPMMAKYYIKIGVIKSGLIIITFNILLYICRKYIANFCFNNPETIKVFISALPFLLLNIFIDTFHNIFQLSMTGMGLQVLSSIIGIISYGLFLLGFGYLFIFFLDYKIIGFWISVSLSSFVTTIGLIVAIICSDFNIIAEKASKNIGEKDNLEKL